MIYYLPFKKEGLNYIFLEEVGETYSGHIIGVFFRFYAHETSSSSEIRVAVADIGSMKDYILPDTYSSLFVSTYSGVFLYWSPSYFIPLDHYIKENHRVIMEAASEMGEVDINGVFIYQK